MKKSIYLVLLLLAATVFSACGGGGGGNGGGTVVAPPVILKSFGAASVPMNGSTSLTFTITNPNTGSSLTGLAFTDNLPAGLVVATPNGLSGACGGTVTATAGASSVSLSGGSIAASGSCTISVNVQGTTPGVKNNSVQITSIEGGTGNTSSADITVDAGPTVAVLTVITQGTSTDIGGVGFTVNLPAGVIVKTDSGGNVDASVVTPSGVAAGQATAISVYTAATSTAAAKLDTLVFSTTPTGFSAGQFATVQCDITSGSPKAADFSLTNFDPRDTNGQSLISSLTVTYTITIH